MNDPQKLLSSYISEFKELQCCFSISRYDFVKNKHFVFTQINQKAVWKGLCK